MGGTKGLHLSLWDCNTVYREAITKIPEIRPFMVSFGEYSHSHGFNHLCEYGFKGKTMMKWEQLKVLKEWLCMFCFIC